MTRERRLKILLPLALLGVGAVGALALLLTRPAVSVEAPPVTKPFVRTLQVEVRDVQLVVRTNGTVTPRTESDLVPEVSGPVTWVAPSLVSGGAFEADEPLLRIDPTDYRIALERTRATLERTRSEHERAKRNLERRRGLARQDFASAAELDDAENAERVAAAALREARATLARAERDLERTEIRAPYTGRVRKESVDVGQFVNRGAPVATIYAVDFAEVRLPVPDRELAFLKLPGMRGDPGADGPGPLVRLSARFAGAVHTWEGHVERTEGEIDPRSRMVHVVARVEDPYGRLAEDDRPPLAVGLFVQAEIVGDVVPAAVVLPRGALRDGDRVLVVDPEDRLRYRDVEIVRASGDEVVIGAGLAAGERVCISPLMTVVDGMEVRALDLAGAADDPDEPRL